MSVTKLIKFKVQSCGNCPFMRYFTINRSSDSCNIGKTILYCGAVESNDVIKVICDTHLIRDDCPFQTTEG